MKFAEPTWLVAGLAVIAALIFLYRVLDKRQRAALAEFASSHLLAKLTASFSPGRRLLKRGLFLAALACIFVALARPQWGYHWVDQKERGIDIFFAIDTSKSMLTQDVNPDRLTRAKMAITDFVRKLDGDRVGLIAFAGEAFLQAPLTLDYDAFQDTLDSIDVNTIPRGGTDIASAIQEAQVAFANNTQNKKILILITDGEDLQGQGIDAARAAAKDGLVVYTVGVGTASGGLIPVPNDGGGTDFLKDPSTGEYVKSHLDESTLTQIAEATGGMYQPLGQEGQGLGVIYDKALASLPKHDLAAHRTRVYEERFQWPLAAGLVLLFASVLIGTRRRTARPVVKAAPARATKAVAALALSLLIVPTAARASVHSAENAFKKGDYSTAEAQYQDAAAQHPDEAPLQYNLGAAAYKSGEYDTALPAFQKALGSDDPALQQQSYYNIGNTQYRIGQKTVKSSPQNTITQWQQAVQAYDGALKLKPDDADAKFNRDFVEKKLEKLEKEQKQNQQQNQKNQQNQQDKNQQQLNQQNQNQQQQNQNQNQQNQDQQQQSGSKGSPGNQQDQQNQNQPQQNGQNQAQNGGQQPNQNGQQQQQQSAGNQNQNQQNQPGQGGQQQQQTAGNQNQDQNKGQNGQQQQTAGNQPQNPQPKGNGGDQQAQMAQNKPASDGATGQAAGADKDKPSGDPTADVALPEGELTKEQAKDLLNSLKGEEHMLPVAQDTRSAKPQDPQVLKDW